MLSCYFAPGFAAAGNPTFLASGCIVQVLLPLAKKFLRTANYQQAVRGQEEMRPE